MVVNRQKQLKSFILLLLQLHLWHSCMIRDRHEFHHANEQDKVTRQHYVQKKLCKNDINMSKNHRHYVHLWTEVLVELFFTVIITHDVLMEVGRESAHNKSQYLTCMILNTFWMRPKYTCCFLMIPCKWLKPRRRHDIGITIPSCEHTGEQNQTRYLSTSQRVYK